MKKTIFLAFAASALCASLVSCNKETLVSGDVKVSANAPEFVSWSGKESIIVTVNGATPTVVQATAGTSADLSATLTNCPSSASIFISSPFSDEYGVNAVSASDLSVNMPASQTSRAACADANAQILFAKSEYAGSLPEKLAIDMESIAANVKLCLTNAPEPAKSVKLTFPANVAGKFTYDVAASKWKENEASAEITVKGGNDNTFYFGCIPAEISGDVLVEMTGEKTGAVYKASVPASKFILSAGRQTNTDVDFKGKLKLYLVGSAVGKETAAEAIEMTANADGTFSWTGTMAGESEFKLIFDKENLTPAFGMGAGFNALKYSTKATAAPFEVAKAGKYSITVYPQQGHIQVCRIFDHVLSDNENACPFCCEYDNVSIQPKVPNDWTSLIGPFLHNHYYDVFDIDDTFKLSGQNSFHIEVWGKAPDWGQGHVFRSGDYKQPYAVEGKTYTVMMQMMYTGDKDEQKIKIGFEGALGTGARTNDVVTLTKDEPFQYIREYTADNTWGGCVNVFISFDLVDVVADVDSPMQFYMDAINIGYDD